MPWDIVRFPWGSMSQHRTRCPSSAKATARFSVVVVLATPPFWLASAITLQVGIVFGLRCDRGLIRGEYSHANAEILRAMGRLTPTATPKAMFWGRARAL